MEPILQKVKLCYSDGSVKMIDQIGAYQLEEIGNNEVNFNIFKGRFIDRVIPTKQDFDRINAIKECKYLLPCGKCDKDDQKCSQYGG